MHDTFDIVVIGAGHAGCEAALACARMGHETLLTTLNLDSLAMMPCNPSIGGTAKGHLVRELDALGGEMGMAIDDVFIQSRMLNTGKGPAVHSLRAQADKRAYQDRMKRALFAQPELEVRQGECGEILTEDGCITGIRTTTGAHIACKAVVICSGVYMATYFLTTVSFSLSIERLKNSVFVQKGQTAVTVIPSFFNSRFKARLKCRTKDLVAP